MTVAAFALVMGSALLHAAWNMAAKRARDSVAFLMCVQVAIAALCVPLLAATFRWQPSSPRGIEVGVVSGVVQAAYLILLGLAYGYADLSLVYPMVRAVAACAVATAAIPLFGETVSARGLLGIALVTLGVFALHIPRDAARLPGQSSGGRWRLAVILGFLTGSIAAYQLIDKAGVALLHPAPYLCVAAFSDTAAFAIWMGARGSGRQVKAEWKAGAAGVVAAAVMGVGSYLLYLWALTLAQVAYLAPLRNFSMVLAVLLGGGVLRERLAWARIPGAAIMFAGVVLLASP